MDAFSLKATLGLDSSSYERGLDQAKQVAGSVFNGVKAVAKVATAAVGAASAGVIALTKSSVQSYAEYEQLVGGVETLFGAGGRSLEQYAKDTNRTVSEAKSDYERLMQAQSDVIDHADAAYKNAGMSANQYMETVTGFSASLLQGLGGDTVAAADVANRAVIDMSDNANKMGTDITSIQNAYQGFAKQNYTMLDNLKLGYGGTKQEMERLIKDASSMDTEMEKLGVTVDANSMSFDNIINAISVMQEHLGIAGTTAEEASKTISGSLAMTKSAWDNLVTGLSDPDADLGALIDNVVDSATIAAGNLIPTIEKALAGVSQLIQGIAPIIADKLPALVQDVLPKLLDAATSLIDGIASALPSLIGILISQIPVVVPQLLASINDLLGNLLTGIQNFDWAGAATKVADMVAGLFDMSNNGGLGSVLDKAFHIVEALAQGLGQAAPTLLPAAMDLITNLANFLTQQVPDLIQAALDLVMGLVGGLTNPNALAGMLEAALNLILTLDQGLIDAIPKLIEAVPSLIQSLVEAIGRFAPQLIVAAISMMIQLKLALIQNIPTLLAAVPDIIKALGNGFKESWPTVKKMGLDLIKTVKEGIMSMSPVQWGKDLIDSFVQGIKNGIGKVKNAVSDIAETVKSYLHFSEPDVGPLANFHTYAPDMMKLFAKGIADNDDIVANQMEKSFALPSIAPNMSGTMNTAGGVASTGNITINVYGAEGQSEERLAEIVSDKLLHQLNMKRSVTPAMATI